MLSLKIKLERVNDPSAFSNFLVQIYYRHNFQLNYLDKANENLFFFK